MWDTFASALLFTSSVIICFHLGRASRVILEEHSKKEPLCEEKTLFEKLFSKQHSYVNSNIHPELYCYETLQKIMKTEKNAHEKEWKTRVLLQNTVYGNIIMFYDVYKQAFAYFSDVQIPYKQLNLCAMKYVRTFLCRDFFVDTTELPEGHVNPFIEMKNDEEKKEREKKEEKKKKLDIDLNSDVFMKKAPPLKSLKKGKSKNEKNKKDDVHEKKSKNKHINNFRHLGKLHNCSLLQPVPKDETQDSEITKHYQYVDFKAKRKVSFSEKFHDLFR